jgi:hypothetical protein
MRLLGDDRDDRCLQGLWLLLLLLLLLLMLWLLLQGSIEHAQGCASSKRAVVPIHVIQ